LTLNKKKKLARAQANKLDIAPAVLFRFEY
jgi:hypothetical protein